MKLATAERRELLPLLAAAVGELPAGAFAQRLSGLGERLAGEIEGPDEEALALFIETLAQSSRLAAEGGRTERLLGSTYRRTARGRQAAEGVTEASALLEALAGQTVQAAGITLVAPGTYALRLETDGLELRLELGPRGVGASAALGES